MFTLEGKIALVTGCGSIGNSLSNGRAIALTLARQGATIFGLDRNLPSAEQTREMIEKEGGTCQVLACDVTEPQQIKTAIAQCLQHNQRIDILVNNVGESQPGDPLTMSQECWEQQFELNLTSSFLTIKEVLPGMIQQGGGSIINISSVAGIRYIGKPQVAYSASKAALIQMSKTTAVLHAHQGIRINCVLPGLMHTALVERLAQKYAQGQIDEFIAQRNQQVPTGQMGSAWDVAHAVAFLASDEAHYINATELIVDGGFTATTP